MKSPDAPHAAEHAVHIRKVLHAVPNMATARSPYYGSAVKHAPCLLKHAAAHDQQDETDAASANEHDQRQDGHLAEQLARCCR